MEVPGNHGRFASAMVQNGWNLRAKFVVFEPPSHGGQDEDFDGVTGWDHGFHHGVRGGHRGKCLMSDVR
jgi:hypothetical protein